MIRACVIRDFITVTDLIINAESAIVRCFFIGNTVVGNTVVSLICRHCLMRFADIEMHVLFCAIRISHNTRATAAVIVVAGIYH